MSFAELKRITGLTPIENLTKNQAKEFQQALKDLGYSVGAIDGLPGSKTRSAWLTFLADIFGSNMTLIGTDAVKLLERKVLEKNNDTDDSDDSSDLSLKLNLLSKITRDTALHRLTREQMRELQTALHRLGYPVGVIDGLIGPKTRTAWSEFEKDVFGGNQLLVGPVSVDILQKKLDEIGGGRIHDFSTKEGTIEAIKWECKAQDIGLKPQIAYVLATTEWETARTFKPVREAFWLSEEWRRENLRYYPYYGRGFVQITWESNYRKYGEILGIDLLGTPDLAMNENVALFILIHGFKTGSFTGRKITDYINNFQTDFVNARRCINGTDHDEDIAELARKYMNGL